jgi:hypothetical protein
VNIILAAGLCSLILSVYFLRLMADGKKLERRLLERRTESSENGQEEEALLIKDAYSTWMALPSCAAGTVGRALDPMRAPTTRAERKDTASQSRLSTAT